MPSRALTVHTRETRALSVDTRETRLLTLFTRGATIGQEAYPDQVSPGGFLPDESETELDFILVDVRGGS